MNAGRLPYGSGAGPAPHSFRAARDKGPSSESSRTTRIAVTAALATALCALSAASQADAQPAVDDACRPTRTPTLPAGHPPLEPANPHARAADPGGGGIPGVFQPPEDTEQEDATLPSGAIAVDLRDPDDRPLAHETVNLGILINSIAKGDSRKHLQAVTDETGEAVFVGLATASNTAYRVTVGYQGGLFAATPFQIPEGKAIRVVLHVYPVSRDMQAALVVVEAVVAAELRDDRLQFEEAMTFYTLGRSAWQPDGVSLSLPDGFTAFTAQASMSDQGVDAISGGARLRGTFAPGQHAIQFRWQMPWTGSPEVAVDVGLPPHVAIARVVMPATSGVRLVVQGFPPAEPRRDTQGQSFLVTERRMRPDDTAMTKLSIGVLDLPTPGPGRNIASALAGLGVVFGLASAVRRRRSAPDLSSHRKVILDDIAQLERARQDGRVGPKTYEAARREMIDALAIELSALKAPSLL